MKRLATVEIYEMEPQERQGVGGITDHGGHTPVDPTYWRIRLASPEKDKAEYKGNAPSILAHELGHVVAHIYQLPVAMIDDLASTAAGVILGSQEAAGNFKAAMELKLEAEKEAWGIAHQMGIPIDPEAERVSIDTYEQGMREAKY